MSGEPAQTTVLPNPFLQKIDHAFAECPKCGHTRRVEWSRRKDMMPPASIYCIKCKKRSDWLDHNFITCEEYMGIPQISYWEINPPEWDNENRKAE